MRKESESNGLATTREVSRACKVSEKTVRNWTKRGMIPALKIGRNVRYVLGDVLEALRKFEITRD